MSKIALEGRQNDNYSQAMANRDYDLRTFARRFAKSPDLLQEYAVGKGIVFNVPKPEKASTKKEFDHIFAEEFIKGYEGLATDGERAIVEKELSEVFDLACKSGYATLLAYADVSETQLPDNLEVMNPYGKALWFYMNHKTLFTDALSLFEVETSNGWRDTTNLKVLTPEEVEAQKDALAQGLRNHFWTNWTCGKNCVVEIKKMPDRVIFKAFVEGQATDLLIFKSGNVIPTEIMRPAEEAHFIYYPKEGRLKTKADADRDEMRKLQTIFRKCVLNDNTEFVADSRVFDLNTLKNENFELATPPDDMVEYSKVFSLTVVDRDFPNQWTTIEVDKNPDGDTIYDLAKRRNINLTDTMLNIVRAKIFVKFPEQGKRGNVTIDLGFPNKHNLSAAKALHTKAKTYIKQIEYAQPNNGAV